MPNQMQTIVEEKIELAAPIEPNNVNKLLGMPYFYQLFTEGLVRFYKGDGKEFSNEESFEFGKEIQGHMGLLDPNKKTIIQIDAERDEAKNIKAVTMKTIKAHDEAPFSYVEYRVAYQGENKFANLSIELKGVPRTPAVKIMAKKMFEQMGRRYKDFSNDPKATLESLDLVGQLKIQEISENESFNELTTGLETHLVVEKNIQDVESSFNTRNFLKKIFSKMVEDNSKNETLEKGNQFKIEMDNIDRTLKSVDKITDIITFDILKVGQEIHLLSNKGVTNFHQVGYRISLKSINDGMTSIELGAYYNRSNKVVFAETVHTLSSFFTDRVPDVRKILKMSCDSMLKTVVRHITQYTTEKLGVKPRLASENELSKSEITMK